MRTSKRGTVGCSTSYSWVKHFAQVCGGLEWRNILLSAFTCYFDASGTQHDQLALAVAGFMSTAEAWLEFEKEWLDRLKRSGLKYFHRKELDLKEYPGLLEDLAWIIRNHAMRKFGMVVRVRALHTLVPKDLYESWHMDAYGFAGRACAAHVRLWAKSCHLRSVPQLIFATGDTGRKDLEIGLERDDFTDYSFKPSKRQKNKKTGFVEEPAIPLQAADLFAYELFYPIRNIESGIHGHELTDVWFILDKIQGEPQVTEDATLLEFEERMKHFTGSSGPGVVLSKWMPK